MSARAPSRPPKPIAPADTRAAKPAERPSAPAAAPADPKPGDPRLGDPRPDEAAIALRPFAQALSRRAIEALAAVMTDPMAPPVARISAATTLLTWGYGRPQGEGECAQASRAEPVIKLSWANSETKPEKRRKAKRRRKTRAKAGAKPEVKPTAKPARS